MEKDKRNKLYETALSKWGKDAQEMMVFEEVGELLNSIAKYRRGRCDKSDVITELADVSIMVEQMALLYGFDEYEKERENKLTRLKERLG